MQAAVASTRVVRALVRLMLLLAVAGCQATASAEPTPSICDGIPSDMGGCAADRPVFTATTCDGLAEEWGADVDRRVVAIINGPAQVGGEGRSVQLSEAVVRSSIVVGMRMVELGIHESCDVANFMPVAEQQYSDAFLAGIGNVIFDGDPVATREQWEERLLNYIGIIDGDDLGEAPASTS